jgi:zinc transport system substrate-binding protein
MERRHVGPFLLKGAWVYLGFLLIFLGICPYAQATSKLKVVTTLFPLQEFSKAVGGEKVQVDLLLPPGAEAHAWEPKVSDLAKVHKADVFVYIGRAMEPWAHDLLAALKGKRLKVVEASAGIQLLEAQDSDRPKEGGHAQKHSREEVLDPHIWLDFSLDLKIIDSILAGFLKKDPNRSGDYQKNAQRYKADLIALDKRYQESLASCRHRRLLLGGHAAFGYLAWRYGLEQTALSGVNPHAEVTPKRMAEIVDTVKQSGAKYIFAEEMVHPKTSQALAREAGVKVLLLNPGANLTAKQKKEKVTFIGMMGRNLQTLQRGLECRNP